MRFLTVTSFALLAGFGAAQLLGDIPKCAASCLEKAISNSNCGLSTYCQCTTGSKQITEDTLSCLCQSESCDQAELQKLTNVTNKMCSQALAVSSKTFTAATLPANACKTGGAGATSSGVAGNNATEATGTTSASSATRGGSAAAASSTGTGAAPTNAAWVGFEGAVVGLAGIALLAL